MSSRLPRPDLASHLQAKQRQPLLNLGWFTIGGVLLVTGVLALLVLGLPWHWQLFGRWLLRQGSLTEIPSHLYPELNSLCQAAPASGEIDSKYASPEIAYGLGRFKCLRSPHGPYWVIEDFYGFNSPSEAAAGSQLSELLVALMGTDYFYEIKAYIPIQKQVNRQ
jgi:hypothetical protein